MNDLHHGMRLAALESRREVREIENAVLCREIDAQHTADLARQAAMRRRSAVLEEWAHIVEELRSLRSL